PSESLTDRHTPACLFLSTLRHPPRSPLFPYTTLFRSLPGQDAVLHLPAHPRSRAGRGGARRRRGRQQRARRRPLLGRAVHQLPRSEEHTSELQSRFDLVCRLLLEKKNSAYSSLIRTYH